MLATLAGRLAGSVLAIGSEALVPADQPERAIAGERAVDERQAARPRRLGEHEPAVGVVEAVDREVAVGEQLRRVARGEPHAERLGLRAVEVRELEPHGLRLVLADRLLDEPLRGEVLRLDAVEVDQPQLDAEVAAQRHRRRAERPDAADYDAHDALRVAPNGTFGRR